MTDSLHPIPCSFCGQFAANASCPLDHRVGQQRYTPVMWEEGVHDTLAWTRSRGIRVPPDGMLWWDDEDHCSVCGIPNDLVTDHCHITGWVRGGLCRKCNSSEGHAWRSDPVWSAWRVSAPRLHLRQSYNRRGPSPSDTTLTKDELRSGHPMSVLLKTHWMRVDHAGTLAQIESDVQLFDSFPPPVVLEALHITAVYNRSVDEINRWCETRAVGMGFDGVDELIRVMTTANKSRNGEVTNSLASTFQKAGTTRW